MSRLVARILLTVFMLLAATLVYILAFILGTQGNGNREATGFLLAGAAAWCFIAGYWLLLWRGAVAWNRSRITTTISGALIGLVAGAFLGMLANGLVRFSGDGSFGCFFGSMTAPLIWLILTVFAWRETPAERRDRLGGTNRAALVCPTCGYNLTGLSTPRCPECGTQFTLDELLASQPQNAVGEIDV